MNEWVTVCRVEDIPRRGARRVARAQGPEVALFRTADDRIFALLDRCPHQGGPLSQGIVGDQGVTCPLHAWTIALDDGRAQAPDPGCTPCFRVRVEAGSVALEAGELRSVGVEATA